MITAYRSLPSIIICVLLNFAQMLLPPGLCSQKKEVDAVYLNSGEVYRGNILDNSDPGTLRLETLCSNIRVFGTDEISRLEREWIDLQGDKSVVLSGQGYFNLTDLGALIGTGNENNAIFSLQMVNGYRFAGKYQPGLGTGLEFFEQAFVPVFADFCWFPVEGRVSPFFRGSLGYSIPLEDPPGQWGSTVNNLGGIMFGAGAGVSVRTGAGSSLLISLFYRYQNLKSDYNDEWQQLDYVLDQQFNRLALRIGFMFD